MNFLEDEQPIEIHEDESKDIESNDISVENKDDCLVIFEPFETHHSDGVMVMIRFLIHLKQTEQLMMEYHIAQRIYDVNYNEFVSKLCTSGQCIVLDMSQGHHEVVLSIISSIGDLQKNFQLVFGSETEDHPLTVLISDWSSHRVGLIGSSEYTRAIQYDNIQLNEIMLELDKLQYHCLFRPKYAVPKQQVMMEAISNLDDQIQHVLQEISLNNQPEFKGSYYLLSGRQKSVLIGTEGNTIARIRRKLSPTTTIIIGKKSVGHNNYLLEIWGIQKQSKYAFELIKEIMNVHSLKSPIVLGRDAQILVSYLKDVD